MLMDVGSIPTVSTIYIEKSQKPFDFILLNDTIYIVSTYPSSAIETARGIVATEGYFPSLCALSDLAKRKLPLDKRTELVNRLFASETPSEEALVATMRLLEYNSVCGKNLTWEQRKLGVGPDGRYRHEEFLVGQLLEIFLERPVFRYYESNDFDFISGKETYDVIGPVPPYYFQENEFINSFYAHLEKQGLDYVVLCTVLLPIEFKETIKVIISELNIETQNRVIVIDEAFCMSNSDVELLC